MLVAVGRRRADDLGAPLGEEVVQLAERAVGVRVGAAREDRGGTEVRGREEERGWRSREGQE